MKQPIDNNLNLNTEDDHENLSAEDEDLGKKCKGRMFMVNQKSGFRIRWDIMIIMLSLWICLILPVQVAFNPNIFETVEYVLFNTVIDLLFFGDIFLNFRTTLIDDITGEETTNSKVIAINYLKGRFAIDVIAAIPFDLIASQTVNVIENFGIVQNLKLLRIGRFTKVVMYLNAT